MKTQKDKYNFSRKSLSQKPGIETFQDLKNKKFYFHINDKGGQAMLYSQAYASAKGRNRGIQTVLKNRKEESRYHSLKSLKLGTHHFILKAGNNQEIGRSREFVTAEELEAQVNYLQNASFGSAPKSQKASPAPQQKKTKKPRVKAFANTKKEDGAVLNKKNALKHAFRIDIYQDEERVFGTGKIKHLLSQEKIAFQGLDFVKIQDFILLHTGFKQENIEQEKPKQKVSKTQNEEEYKKILSEIEASQKTLKQMFVTTEGSLEHKNLIKKEDGFSINMELSAQDASSAKAPLGVKIWANSLSSGGEIVLVEKYTSLAEGSENLHFPIASDSLAAGVYRIKSKLMLRTKKQKTQSSLLGNCLLRVT